jgi:hypothetical protein
MLNKIKQFFTGINNYPVIHLGRWAIKHENEACNRYMQELHADPGYYSPGEINSKKKKNKDLYLNNIILDGKHNNLKT